MAFEVNSDESQVTTDTSQETNQSSTVTTDTHASDLEDLEASEAVYANQEQSDAKNRQLYSQPGDSSDEVDPRKLLRDPTLSEIRWYYRREMGGTLVKKPIKDAFKNGFETSGDNADRAMELMETPTYQKRDSFVEAHKMAEYKSRRDGFALLFIGTEDSTAGAHVSPVGSDVQVDEITHLNVWTIDDLSDSGVVHDQIREGTGLDQGDYWVRESGIVVNRDAMSRDFNTPVGYVLGTTNPQFVHADRVVHYVWNPDVDGPYKTHTIERFDDAQETLGEWEGDSVLMPSYDLLKGLAKGNWAIMQALFRHASHMYDVQLPSDADENDLTAAVQETRNINAKSALVVPDGYEVTQHESGNEMDPSSHYDVIFDQICANHEMTRSVLFGTQSGTVSGSETDIKNYFNQVERYRTGRATDKMLEYLTQATRILDGRTDVDYEFTGVEFEFGPLFKLDRDTRVSMLQTQSSALSTLIGSYVLTPDEARGILNEEWSDIDFDDLTERQKDELDRIRLATSGQGEQALASEGEYTNSPGTSGEETSGRPEGSQQQPEESQSTPRADGRTDETNGFSGDSRTTDEDSQQSDDSPETDQSGNSSTKSGSRRTSSDEDGQPSNAKTGKEPKYDY